MATHNSRSTSRLLITLIFFSFLMAACAQSASPTQVASNRGATTGETAPQAPQAAPAVADNFNTGSQATDSTRIVIKNANMTIVVDDPSKSADAIIHLAESMNGFVVSANIYQTTINNGQKVPRASVTVRIPAERLEEAMAQVEALSKQAPLSRTIQSQDVTSDYTDLQSRLRNLENTEQQLTKIMDEATTTEDVMSVYNKLVDVREQIEVTKGKIQYYEQSAALSALSVDLLANEAVQPLTIGSWQPVGVAKNAVQALINTTKFLANAAIWLVILVLPVLLVLYVIFFLPLRWIWRRLRRNRGAKSVTPAPPAPPSEA